MLKRTEIKCIVLEYDDATELSEDDRELLGHAKEAALQAYAPYSGFLVGAALRLDDGMVIRGNNQENAAFPSGMCAERVALYHASSNHPDAIITGIALVAFRDGEYISGPVPPCGCCRQVMVELENRQKHPLRVILGSNKKVLVVSQAADLLPLRFDRRFLRKD